MSDLSAGLARHAGAVFVVKYGGNAVTGDGLAGFAADIVALARAGIRVAVVHGGGPQIGAMLARLNLASRFVEGLRVTDAATMEVAEMVLAGAVNPLITAAIVDAAGPLGPKPVGLSGHGAGILRAEKLHHPSGDLGLVGRPVAVDAALLTHLCDAGYIPVIAPLATGPDGRAWNVNADTAAGAIAAALKAARFFLLTDVPGVLDAAKSLIPHLSDTQARALMADGTIHGGMIPKVETCLTAVAGGVAGAVILDGRMPGALRAALAGDSGTLIGAAARGRVMTLDPLSLALGLLAGLILGILLALVFAGRARDAFRAVSADALAANNRSFLDLAEQHLGRLQEAARGDFDRRAAGVETSVAPLAAALAKLDFQMAEVEKTRIGAYEGLKTQVGMLAETQLLLKGETGRLVQAMRTPMGRGGWGEMQLSRMLELAGMAEGADYDRQPTIAGEDGALRPDIVIRLPGGKSIVIDAKAPLEAYFAAIEAADDDTRAARLKDHARQVRQQMKNLAEKSYWKRLAQTPEFVVMFLPSEGACATALQSDPDLIEAGMRAGVVIATPLTLFALLRTIAYSWRQERVAENAAVIAALGRDLYERIAGLASTYQKLGDSLRKSVDTYNLALGQIETRVLVTARRLKDQHDIVSEKEIAAPPGIDATPRPLSAPELTAAEGQAEG